MRNLFQTRIVFTPVRHLPWTRWNWGAIGALLFCLAFWVFVIYCAAKVVR